jgi:ABC-type sugar transport system substrate-binding protein
VPLRGGDPAPVIGRRSFLGLAAALLAIPAARSEEARRYKVGFANLTEDPGVRLEGFGFTGADVRTSFALAARTLPIDMVFFDNDRDRAKTLASAESAVAQRLDAFVEYSDDATANAEVAKRLKAAGIPIVAITYPVPGAPLYGPDNQLAGRIAGDALAGFALSHWAGMPQVAVLLGDLANSADHVTERVEGIAAALKEKLPDAPLTRLDSGGNGTQAEALLRRFAAAQSGKKLLIVALDDTTALLAKSAVEEAGRANDSAIVSQGCDHTVHGGMSDKKELDPSNRGSILIGSVAYRLDRYGYDVLPLVLKLLSGEPVPPRVATRHMLVSAANVFSVYPPIDMN